MIEFRTFGALDLRAADGRTFPAVLSGSKRVALLAYLALATPRGFHRRDTLLALLWPDLDQRRARNALRNLVHSLRRELGSEAILNRGSEEMGIAWSHLWCDAEALQEALHMGRLEEAIALYRGNLLDGFHLAGGLTEFERWLDGERDRLRRLATNAGWSVSDREAEAGRPDAALVAARWAMACEPEDERALRRLLQLYHRCDRPAEALRTFEKFALRLHEELEMEPSAETRALVDTIREGARQRAHKATYEATSHGLVSATPKLDAVTEIGSATAEGDATPPDISSAAIDDDSAAPEIGPADARAEDPAASGADVAMRMHLAARSNESSPRVRRLARIAVWTTGAILLLAGSRALWTQRSDTRLELEPDRVAVFPFSVHGSDETRHLGTRMADLLSSKLDGAGSLTTVEVQPSTRDAAPDALTDASAVRGEAERLGAGRYVLGQVTELGEGFQLSATLFATDTGEESTATVDVVDETNLIDAVDGLVVQLLARRGNDAAHELERVAAASTASLTALKAYLQGEHLFRSGQFARAQDAYRAALREDSTLAVAAYRLAMASDWAPGVAVSQVMIPADGRLPSHIQMLLEAEATARKGLVEEAEERYRGLLGRDARFMEAWWGLGELLFHYGPARGLPICDARLAFDHVLAFDRANTLAMWHLLRIAASAADTPRVGVLADSLMQLNPNHERSQEIRALAAFLGGDESDQASLMVDLDLLAAGDVVKIAERLAVDGGNVAPAHRVASSLTKPGQPRESRLLGHVTLAQLELAVGRRRAAGAELEAAEVLAPEWALLYEAWMAILPWATASRAELSDLYARLGDWDAEAEGWSPPVEDRLFSDPSADPRWLRIYLLGVLDVALDNDRSARGRADQLVRLDGAIADASTAWRLGRSLRARALFAAGNFDAALAALEQLPPGLQEEPIAHLPFNIEALDRFLLAELLARTGRHTEAVRWFDSFENGSLLDLVFLGPSQFRRAEIRDKRNETALAAGHLSRFLELWSDADAEPRFSVENAAARLEALREMGVEPRHDNPECVKPPQPHDISR